MVIDTDNSVSTARHETSARPVTGRSGYIKLRYCRVLLSDLDPRRPPTAAQAREFQWQYRALSERVDVLSERLAATSREPSEPLDESLRKAEAAVDLSLQYFHDVLSDGDGDGDDRDA